MDWKDAVNKRLSQATGYTFVREERLRTLRELEAEPATATTAPAKPKRPLPDYYDDEAKATIRRVRKRTMTAHEKLHGLIEATRYVVRHDVPGTLVECGVWRGGSMQAAALTLMSRGATDRDLHLYDTFEGMSEPTEKDRDYSGRSAAELLATKPRTAKVWAVAGIDDVREGMDETGYPADRIHYHVGRVEETIPAEAPEQIALLRLDTDWYESTRHELDHLYDRVAPGGVIIFDDYGTWQGARQAVDEFIAETGAQLLLVPVASGRFTIKP